MNGLPRFISRLAKDDPAAPDLLAPAPVGVVDGTGAPGPIEAELLAMRDCHAALAGLDQAAQQRVMRWLAETLAPVAAPVTDGHQVRPAPAPPPPQDKAQGPVFNLVIAECVETYVHRGWSVWITRREHPGGVWEYQAQAWCDLVPEPCEARDFFSGPGATAGNLRKVLADVRRAINYLCDDRTKEINAPPPDNHTEAVPSST